MDKKKLENLSMFVDYLLEQTELNEKLSEKGMEYDLSSKLEDYVNNSQKVKKIVITDDTLVIAELPKKYEPYRSLSIEHGRLLISKETTNQIMKKYFIHLGMSYDNYMTYIKEVCLQKWYKVPYVFSGKMILPVSSICKGSYTWCFVQDITGIEENNFDQVKILFSKGNAIILDINRYSFEKQLSRAIDLYEEQMNALNLFVNLISSYSINYDQSNVSHWRKYILNHFPNQMIQKINHLSIFIKLIELN